VTNLCEIITIFNSDQLVELVIHYVSMMTNLFTACILATLHIRTCTVLCVISQLENVFILAVIIIVIIIIIIDL